MAVTNTAGKNAAKSKKTGAAKQTKGSKLRIGKLVEEAIDGIERRLSDEKAPPTIGDYLKVMQLQKEIEEDTPKEIKITWVEPVTATTPGSEK
jgi:hypothetical protein